MSHSRLVDLLPVLDRIQENLSEILGLGELVDQINLIWCWSKLI